MPRFWERPQGINPQSQYRRPISTYTQKGWPGGWQPDKPHSALRMDELHECQNLVWLDGHALRRRGGFEKITTDVAGMDEAQFVYAPFIGTAASVSAQPSFTQQVMYFNDDDGELWVQTMGELLDQEQNATGTDLVYSSQSIGPWDSSTTNYFRTWNVEVIVFGEIIYATGLRFGGYSGVSTAETHDGLAAGASKPIKYDVEAGTYSRPVPHAFDGSTSGFPSARCAITAYNRVFVANVYNASDSFRYPSHIWFSDAGTAETYPATAFLKVGADDGTEITSMTPMGEGIFITKDNSCWLLLGTNDEEFKLREVNPNMGCTSTRAVTYHEGIIYFFDPSHGLIRYDGARFENISEPINEYLFQNFNYESDFRVNVTQDEDRIYLSIPTGSGISNMVDTTFVYDTRLKTWAEWDFGIPCDIWEYITDHSVSGIGLAGAGQPYCGTADGTNLGVFRLDSLGVADEKAGGDALVVARLVAAWFGGEQEYGNRHRLRRLDVLSSSGTTPSVSIDLYRDFKTDTAFTSTSFDPSGANDAWHAQDQGIDHATDMWTWLQVDINWSATASAGTIEGIQLSYSSRPWRRGVQGNLNQ